MVDGEIEPLELREEGSDHRSMISSATMLRVLGGGYKELTRPSKDEFKPMSRSDIEVFFKTLSPKMKDVPIEEDDPFWMPTGAFLPASTAPSARQGSMSTLSRTIVDWARNGHPALPALSELEEAV
jgi:hypothetical protein